MHLHLRVLLRLLLTLSLPSHTSCVRVALFVLVDFFFPASFFFFFTCPFFVFSLLFFFLSREQLAKTEGYDLSAIAGTGPGGRVIAADVKEFVPGIAKVTEERDN